MKLNSGIRVIVGGLARLGLMSVLSVGVFAFERDYGAHVHGYASLAVVLEGEGILLEFNSPAFNIVGFEHPPHTQAQRTQVEQAAALLSQTEQLFSVSGAGDCAMAKGQVVSALLPKAQHEKQHREHGQAPRDDQPNIHKGLGEHAHPLKPAAQTHSEFTVEYLIRCTRLSSLTAMEVKLMGLFPAIKGMQVQVVGPSGQRRHELSAGKAQVSF